MERSSSIHPQGQSPGSDENRQGKQPHHMIGNWHCIDGRNDVQSLLGRGGFAEVWACWDRTRERRVAVKILALAHRSSPEYRRRLRREADIAASIRHPNVVETFGAGETEEGDPYVVMEILHGQTVAERIECRGPMDTPLALHVIRQAAAGLEAAHLEGIVHRDVKPSNLFLCERAEQNGSVTLKVFDFGFAKAPLPGQQTGSDVLGTLQYMAPEQVVSEPADARADVYALGVTLYRLVTGELPFDGPCEPDLLAHHLMSPVPPPSWLVDDLEPDVETLILTATRKNPANRYATVTDMLDDVERLRRGAPIVGAPLLKQPDRFSPTTDLGRYALALLERRHQNPPESSGVQTKVPGPASSAATG